MCWIRFGCWLLLSVMVCIGVCFGGSLLIVEIFRFVYLDIVSVCGIGVVVIIS